MNGPRHVEVVVEAVGDGWSDAEFGLGEELLHGLGQHVGGGVADDAAAVVGVGGDRHHVDVGFGNPRQVAQPPLEVSHDDDGLGFTAARQTRFSHRRTRGRPGSDPDRGC